MQLSLSGLWQLSPLTDLTIPQADLSFPAPLSDVLPKELSESQIAEQEWHLMHDIEVDEKMLAYPVVNLVVGGVDSFAEIRLNGEAVFDCDGSEVSYKKEVKRYLQLGRNRFEILFLEQEEDWLLDDDVCRLGDKPPRQRDHRLGIWQAPSLDFIRHVSLDYITTEQIWHDVGGCEFKVDLFYQVYSPGLVSANVKFNGVSYQIPLDIRTKQATALFQIDAPRYTEGNEPEYFYLLEVQLGEQKHMHQVNLNPNKSAQHYPI